MKAHLALSKLLIPDDMNNLERRALLPRANIKTNSKKIMATYHLTVKSGARGKAQPHAAYIAREGKYSAGTHYEDLEATDYGNMPEWAKDNPAKFWKSADDNERVNGSPEQRLSLVHDFINQEIGEKHAYQFGVHIPKAALESGEQPHAHIMYSERLRDGIERDPEQYFKRYNAKNPERGGNKKASGGKLEKDRKEELVQLRERWATLQNTHLEKHGHENRVDSRSLKDQGITDRDPEKHLGGAGVRNPHKKNNVLAERTTYTENLQTVSEVQTIINRHKKQTATLNIATSAAEKLKNKLAERAQAQAKAQAASDAEAQRQDQARRIEQNKIEVAQKLAQLKHAEREPTKPASSPEQPKKPQSKDHDIEM